MTFANGDVYEGDWKDNKRDGKGKMTFANGDVYEGDWKDNKRDGKGKETFANGNVYEGDWKDDKRNGKGKETWANDYVYEGDWKDHHIHGYGIMKYANGDVYEGEYKDGERDGKGKETLTNGDVYEGDWNTDRIHGDGIMKYANGDVYDGQWDDVVINEDGDEQWTIEKNGEGVMKYANGNVYDGEWVNGLPHGFGHFKFKQYKSKEYEGHFIEGERNGKGRMILDGIEEPMRTWQNGIIVPDITTSGLAMDVHEKSGKINLEKYQKLMLDFFDTHHPANVDDISKKFADFIHDHAAKFSDNPRILQELNKILNKLKNSDRFGDPIVQLSFGFLFAQPDDFIEFYIKAFHQDCYHAYGIGGNSCVKGIYERVYMIIGDAAFSICPDPDQCDNPFYTKLLQIFNKHIDKNAFTQEWANQITPDILAMSTKSRKHHYVAFMKKKYQDLDMYTVDTRKQIKAEADKLEYVFDKEKNPEMIFGGSRGITSRRSRRSKRGYVARRTRSRRS
jgi:hypothetical protein